MRPNLLPALLPGWRFFDEIGPSPRVDYALLPSVSALADADWQPFRPAPLRLGLCALLWRLLWNPERNETLYVLRCAERVLEGDSGFPLHELQRRIDAAARAGQLYPRTTAPPALLVFRVRGVWREGASLVEQVAFIASPWAPGTVAPE